MTSAARQPSLARRGNLQWTHHGMVYATYFAEALDYGLRPPDEKEDVADHHEALRMALPNNAVLLSLLAPLDLADAMERALDNIDLQRTPDYIPEAVAGFRRIRDIGPLTRVFAVTIPVGNHHITGEPDDAEVAAQTAAAAALLNILDADDTFGLTPVPEGLLPWIWNHNLMRGAALEVAPANPARARAATPVTTFFRPGVLDEGARAERSLRHSFDPILKTMVRLDDGQVIESYQTMLVTRSFPTEMLFPGRCEYLSILDDGDVGVDWAMRVHRRSRDEAMRLNEKALGELAIQMGEREQGIGFHAQQITRKITNLASYNAGLDADESAEEVEFTTALAIGAPSTAELSRAVQILKGKYRKLGIRLHQPRGAQEPLWMMFNPGHPDHPAYTKFSHIMSSPDWAATVPFTTARLLDDTGPVIGVNLLSGLFEPLHFDVLGKVLADLSASIAVSGESGSGKTYFVKTLLSIIADLAGQFLAIDRSQAGEYLPLADCIDGSVVISFDNPDFSLDALQMFSDPVVARRMFLDTILPLLNIPVVSGPGRMLSRTVQPECRAQFGLHTSADVRDHLAQQAYRSTGQDADDMHTLVRAMDEVEAPVLFGRGLPPMPMGATATFVRTNTLALPTAEELTTPHAYANLTWRKRLGHALYELVGLLAREQFLRPGRFGALVVDEAFHFTAAPVGRQIVEEFVRDGRKHSAGIILSSQDPRADYAGAAHDLIPNRFAFRQRDEKMARGALEWLGVDVDRDKYLIKQLRRHTSPPQGKRNFVPVNRRGECFIADSRGRIGRGKILGPARPDRAAAVSTTPSTQEAA